jgi:hypothetical protein
MLILIIIVLLVLGAGGGYYGHNRWGYRGGAGTGLGTILVVLLIAYLLALSAEAMPTAHDPIYVDRWVSENWFSITGTCRTDA